MQALVWEAPRQMAIHDAATPQPGAGEVLIKVAYAGICGSELSGYLGHNALRVPPLVMGHEFSGTIIAADEAAQAEYPELALGQRVTVNPMVYCGHCASCQEGKQQLCLNRTLIGAGRPGAYAEYVSVPAKMVVTLPDDMTLRTASLVEPVAVAIHIGELAGAVADAVVLVIGAGPIGLLTLQVLRGLGARRVFVADLDAARLDMAAALGGEAIDPRNADVVALVREATGGVGAVVAIDAVGTARTRAQCVSATRSGGTVILSGLHEETSAMPVAEMIRREIVARGSFCYTPANFVAARDMLARGAIQLDPWIVEAPLAEGGAWFDRLIDAPGAVAKVLLVLPDTNK